MNTLLKELGRMRSDDIDAREQQLAEQVRIRLRLAPAVALTERENERLQAFNRFCEQRSVSALPARCETVAAFLLEIADIAALANVLDLLDALERLHDLHSLPSPVRSSIVAEALAHWDGYFSAPRSWPNPDKVLFLQLPLLVQHVVVRRETQRDRELQRLQSKVALQEQKAA